LVNLLNANLDEDAQSTSMPREEAVGSTPASNARAGTAPHLPAGCLHRQSTHTPAILVVDADVNWNAGRRRRHRLEHRTNARVVGIGVGMRRGLVRGLGMSLAEPAFTFGIEEEYHLVDRASRDLAAAPQALMSACEAELGAQVSPEFLRSQIEVGTRPV